eukprot:15139679-Heterocapsa_arctica.AAC.1
MTQRRKRDKELMMADQEKRTMEMDHIVVAEEMGKVCQRFTSVDDFKSNQSTVCKKPGTCLCCKGYMDTLEMD